MSRSSVKSGQSWGTFFGGEFRSVLGLRKREPRKIHWIFPADLVYHHPRAPGYFKTSHYFKHVFFRSLVEDLHFLSSGRCANETNRHAGSRRVILYFIETCTKHENISACSPALGNSSHKNPLKSLGLLFLYIISSSGLPCLYIYFLLFFSFVSLLPLFPYLKSTHLFVGVLLHFSQAAWEPYSLCPTYRS